MSLLISKIFMFVFGALLICGSASASRPPDPWPIDVMKIFSQSDMVIALTAPSSVSQMSIMIYPKDHPENDWIGTHLKFNLFPDQVLYPANVEPFSVQFVDNYAGCYFKNPSKWVFFLKKEAANKWKEIGCFAFSVNGEIYVSNDQRYFPSKYHVGKKYLKNMHYKDILIAIEKAGHARKVSGAKKTFQDKK